jgi:hypothetical protein
METMSYGTSVSHREASAQVPSFPATSPQGARLVPFTPRPHRTYFDNDLIDHYGPLIGLEGVAVYCAYQRYANRQTGQCWPSVARIARQLKTSQPRVRKYLKLLNGVGLIDWEERYSPAGDRTSNLYTVHPATRPAPEESAQTPEIPGRNDLDLPPEQNPPGGGSAVFQEQDLEQENRTSGLALSALKTQQPVRSVDRDRTGPSVFPLTREERLKHEQQQRCQHPLHLRRRTDHGESWCGYCRLEFPRLVVAAGPPDGREEGPYVH